jgi:hypothetical protein
MKDYKITLNFLPLNNSDFAFQVYRRKINHLEKSWNKNIYRYNLPDENNNYTSYWVSFSEFEDSELYKCFSNINFELTKEYLKTLVFQNIEEQELKLHIQSKKFEKKRLYILLEKIKDANGKVIGDKTIWLEPYFLKVKGQFGFLIDFRFIKSANYPFNREVQRYSLSLNKDYRTNVDFNIDKYNYLANFIRNYFSKISTLTDEIIITSTFIEIAANTLNTKQYIFNNKKTDNSQFKGIMNYGPYQKVDIEPYYFYVFKQEHKPYATDLLNALNGNTYNTFKGFEKFGLPNQTSKNTKAVLIDSYSDEARKIIIDEIKNSKEQNPIIISIIPQSEEQFYFKLKSECLRENVPSQTVHIETINNYNQLKWSVGSIALQIFSKLNGIPWIVSPSNENCLIVGIGQANKRNKTTNKLERFYSYSVLLDSSGRFFEIKQLADETDKQQFLHSLANNIRQIIEEYQTYDKIVFHIPEKIKNEDILHIEKILKEADSKIELSIIKINDDSKIVGFNKNENSLVPYESSFLQLSEKEYLLWSEGLNYHNKRVLKRYSSPLHITFFYSNKEENFNDHRKYLQDILNLSGANYRGFNAKALPVSVYYPKLIAGFSKHFKELDLEFVANDSNKPWFL